MIKILYLVLACVVCVIVVSAVSIGTTVVLEDSAAVAKVMRGYLPVWPRHEIEGKIEGTTGVDGQFTIAQLIINDRTVVPQVKQNGWHLDSVQIIFDGTGVVGLGSKASVRAFFQGTYTDVNGVVSAVPVGTTVVLEDSAAVAKVLKASVSVYSVREVLRDAVWRQAAPKLGVDDSTLTANWGVIVTVPK